MENSKIFFNISEKARQILNSILAKTKHNEKYSNLFDTLKTIEQEKDRANDLYKRGDYDGAIILYTKLLEMDTNNKTFNSTILANRALCYQKKNRLIDALTDINKSIKLKENYWKAYYRRANINLSLKNLDQAKHDLNTVLKLDSSKYIYEIR